MSRIYANILMFVFNLKDGVKFVLTSYIQLLFALCCAASYSILLNIVSSADTTLQANIVYIVTLLYIIQVPHKRRGR